MAQEDPLKNEWLENKANYTKKSLLIKGWQVMQYWEDNYMKDLANIATSEGGNILELGFGLGISAGYIQKSKKILKHTIIEAHPEVVKRAFRLFNKQFISGRMQILQGFWENVAPLLKDESFDGILFDTSPLDQETVFFHYFPFFEEAYRLLKKGGVFTYFSDEPTTISPKHKKLLNKVGFKKIDYKICKVNPPKDCRYWSSPTIISPIVYK
jgi:guanidinoacetate N-methyltransferase